MNAGLLITYCTTIFIASIIPGPSMMLAMSVGQKKNSFLLGNLAALGNVTASIIQALASIFVVYTIGSIHEEILTTLKMIGAIYIIYIGIQLFKVNHLMMENVANKKREMLSSFIDGFALAIANPKAIIFFVAFFPAFIDSGSPLIKQLFIILTPITIIAYLCFLSYVLAGNMLRKIFSNNIFINRALAIGIICAGVSIIFF